MFNEYAKPLSWCNAKYPYTKDCWAASHGRVLNHLACKACDMFKGNISERALGGRREANFY